MSMLLWIDEEKDVALDLGDPILVWKAFGAMAKVAGKDDGWEELFSVPGFGEQDVEADWLKEVSVQAARFQKEFGDKLTDDARWILEQLEDPEKAMREHDKEFQRQVAGLSEAEDMARDPEFEAKHHRGQPDNPGKFGPGAGTEHAKAAKLPALKKPKVSLYSEYTSGSIEALSKFFGKKIDEGSVGAMACGVDGAQVRYAFNPNPDGSGALVMEFSAQGVKVIRSVYRKTITSRLVMENEKFFIDQKSRHKGKGLQLFLNQVQALRQAGFAEIQTNATGAPGTKMNGYYTWPRMGYDGSIDDAVLDRLPTVIKKQMKTRSILDLFAIPGGKEWWKKHGETIYNATFDLREGSRSLQVLGAYLEERRKGAKR